MVDFGRLTSDIKRLLGSNLSSLIVFGSYARGDYTPKSDVDLIVVVKEKTKHVINLMSAVEESLIGRARNWAEKKTNGFLNLIGFKRSIFLFDESEFEKKRFNFCDSRFLSWFLIPKGIIWRAIKNEGKIVYGSNLLNFKPRISVWDKIKAPLPGIGACLFAGLIFVFARDKAVALAQTGLRWTYMNVNGLLKRSNISSVFGNLVEIFRVAFNASYV